MNMDEKKQQIKNKIVFIVPYFGTFPPYFMEWMYSAGYLADQNIDFLLITNNELECLIPSNIRLLPMSFEEFRKKVQDKFDFQVALDTPYKICDFKPALGYIFQDEINQYQFWGNCDIDQVWGDVRKFITDDILNQYDRIQFLGHFILYRNVEKINTLFMKKGGIYDYQKVYSTPMHYSFCEHSGMMSIVVKNNISNYIATNYIDVSPTCNRIWVLRVPNYHYQIIYWSNGKVYRTYLDKNERMITEEYMYFHFQRKSPKGLECWESRTPKAFLLHKDSFIEFVPSELTIDRLKILSDFISEEEDRRENREYIISNIKRFFKIPMQNKILWIKQKIATRKLIQNVKYFGEHYSNV
ncbi:MAG: DUF6625 family protein [Lachnospiraceae bacterium]